MALLTRCFICGRQIYNSTNPDYDIYKVKVKDIIGSYVPEEKKEEFYRWKEKFPDCFERVCKNCAENAICIFE